MSEDDDLEYENEEDIEDDVMDLDEIEEDSLEVMELKKTAPPDVWNTVLKGLGSDYAAISVLPAWLDAENVESLDWK